MSYSRLSVRESLCRQWPIWIGAEECNTAAIRGKDLGQAHNWGVDLGRIKPWRRIVKTRNGLTNVVKVVTNIGGITTIRALNRGAKALWENARNPLMKNWPLKF